MNGNGSWPLTCYYLGVTEGTRTPDTRDHNPVLYQLSYSHHVRRRLARRRPMIATPRDCASSGFRRCRAVPALPGGPAPQPPSSCAAIAFASSTSGPGAGTNTVRR